MSVSDREKDYDNEPSTNTLSSKDNLRETLLCTWSPTYLLRTLWLLTYSDLATFVLPKTIFGYFSALSPMVAPAPAHTTTPLAGITLRIPHIVVWAWLNTVVFNLANQRQHGAIVEDRINKPWRPLPAGRLSPAQARQLLVGAIPVVLAVTHFLGGFQETALLFVLNWVYNDLGVADEDGVLRNLNVAVAYVLYGLGALKVACGAGHCTVRPLTYTWLYMIGSIILTTVHVQDLKDVDGDRARNRKTLPLVIGQEKSRWSIAIAVLCWSAVCPWFWDVPRFIYGATGALGLVVAIRVTTLRSFEEDRTTWKIWAYWLITCYVLPAIHLIYRNHMFWVIFGDAHGFYYKND